MNSQKWREEVVKLLQEMPAGTCFQAREIAKQFNRFGPSAHSVGRWIRITGLAVLDDPADTNAHLWRRV